nr:PHP-associated domain-containing protein [Candidatus Sigynarchaeota archaeon]
MPFHQFVTREFIPYSEHGKIRSNPLDLLFQAVGLKRLGLDAIAEYCRRYSANLPEVKPWLPAKLPATSNLLDFHCHTSFSDGEGTHESILRRIGRGKFLDGIAFTDHPWHLAPDHKTRIPDEKVVHHSYKAKEIVDGLKKKGVLPDSFITFEGSAEFAPKGTEMYPTKGVELIGIGLPRDFIESRGGLGRIRKMLAEDLVEKIHDDGGIAIVPHPFYFMNSSSPALWHSADAVEAFNQTTHFMVEPAIKDVISHATMDIPMVDSVLAVQLLFGYFAWRNRIQLARFPRPEVGSSDAHVQSFVGAGCTAFSEPVIDIEDLRARLRRREGQAIVNPRWDDVTDFNEILQSIWSHWGAELVKKIGGIMRDIRALVPPLKILTSIFGHVKRAHLERARYLPTR